MTKQHSFRGGQLDDRAGGRVDLEIYGQMVKSGNNMSIDHEGSLSSRPGTQQSEDVTSSKPLRVIGWTNRIAQLDLHFTSTEIKIYENNTNTANVSHPFSISEIDEITFVSDGVNFFIAHKSHPVQLLERLSPISYSLTELQAQFQFHPSLKYEAEGTTLTPSATTGSITLTASTGFFVAGHVGVQFEVEGNRVTITSVTSGTIASATVIDTLAGTAPTSDWEEQAYSGVRGHAEAIGYHQGRLVLAGGGNNELQVHLSRSGQFDSFQKVIGGTIPADAAISAVVNSNEAAKIRHILSMGPLVLFHDKGVVADFNSPITPESIGFSEQQAVGIGDIPPEQGPQGAFYIRTGGGNQPLILLQFDDISARLVSQPVSQLNQELVDGARNLMYIESSTFDTNESLFIQNGDNDISAFSVSADLFGGTPWEINSEWTILTSWKSGNELKVILENVSSGNAFIGTLTNGSFFDLNESFAKVSGSPNIVVPTTFNGATVRWRSGDVVSEDLVVAFGLINDANLIGVTGGDWGIPFQSKVQPLSQTPGQQAGRKRPLNRGRVDVISTNGLQLRLLDQSTGLPYNTEQITPEDVQSEGWFEFELEDDGDDRDPEFEFFVDGGKPLTIRQYWFFRG